MGTVVVDGEDAKAPAIHELIGGKFNDHRSFGSVAPDAGVPVPKALLRILLRALSPFLAILGTPVFYHSEGRGIG
jgi:hypothetical protein